MLAGGLKFGKSEAMLTMIDNRSGVQIGVAMGTGKKTSFSLGGGGIGGGGFGALGGYSNTPEGKLTPPRSPMPTTSWCAACASTNRRKSKATWARAAS